MGGARSMRVEENYTTPRLMREKEMKSACPTRGHWESGHLDVHGAG